MRTNSSSLFSIYIISLLSLHKHWLKRMKAFLISAENQAIETTDITSMEDIVKHIGYDTIESDALGTQGDRLYFDEECFLRGSEGHFKIDTLVPVSGKGVVVGTIDDGASFSDVAASIDDLRSRIQYL